MSCVRLSRTCCAVLLGGILLAGCSGGGGGGGGGGGPKPSASGSASPTATGSPAATGSATATGSASASASTVPDKAATPTALDFTYDPARAPRNRADAQRLARAVLAEPDSWGPGFTERTPYLSPDGYWPVLPASCRWETGALPSTVLHSVTGYSEVPAKGAKGLLQVAATVTVHTSVDEADWEMAQTLEEALRCPDQTLRDGEKVTGLFSIGTPFGVNNNFTAADSLNERGKYVRAGVKGEHFYGWSQSRVGPVTLAVSAKGSAGHSEDEISTAMIRALVTMLNRTQAELEVKQ
ncbi:MULTISPECIES: hypothetical protein [Streptomyces]|uniref:Lipoprotein n=2 Tax=Streptomyces TaxID=1883 RepID=A0ABU4K8A0_9ACTN|nr:hypothetical protein [Streptomyces roseolus]MDX2293952.1 hypothetical protein [Streptomyces roseolus]